MKTTAIVAVVFLAVGFVVGLFIPPVFVTPAQVKQVKFTTDWAWQGVYAPYLVPVDKGFYSSRGYAVIVDRGYGSADAASKIAAGAYDFGIVDLAVLTEFNSKNPGRELLALCVVYNYSPLSIMTLKKTGIAAPKDLQGKKIAAPEGAAARRLFPLFARNVGINPQSVEWVSVSPALREPLLVRGEVDATAPFIDAVLTLKQLGVRGEDIVVFHYPEYGLDLYGLALVTRKDVIEKDPATVRVIVEGVIYGWQESIKNPDQTINFLRIKDPTVNATIEKERLLLAIDKLVLTPEVRQNGLCYASPQRLARHIDIVTEGMELPRKISVNELFTDRFLPPAEARRP
ncbi:MAG: ABC transporter substrate-binding protein [Candidatus Caldarchaeum sp.]|nr:ABC transporter substrate-binding protein [Candidatus Caldarchaeum sp.]MCX8201542.1 ABC transporter substrate-binding protein [Candidatus Caldarchaeum sp.]MDW8434599.1 ABC transporter substrate-binding protein [Candidatus Caldarchaeum sp.]